jgi:uncharacterized membrane protein YfcA
LPEASESSRHSLLRAVVVALLVGLCAYGMLTAPAGRAVRASSSDAGALAVVGVIGIGLVIGCYGTIVGIGGGPIIMPVLIWLYGWKTEALVGTCLLIVFLNALSGSIGYLMQGRVDLAGATKFSLAAVPGTILAGFVHHLFDFKAFSVLFGVFLLGLALYSCVTIDQVDDRPRATKSRRVPRSRHVRIVDRFGHKFDFYANDNRGMQMNLGLGFFSGFMGIGGGVLQVPMLHYLLWYPPHIATATSHFVTMVTCAAALTPHLLLGNVHYEAALWIGAGVLVGAQLGARMAPRISSKAVMALFVIVLLVFAGRLLLG